MSGPVTAFRIVKTSRTATALDGEGARRAGGRWNSPGVRMVYAASSLSLATLEIMVHLEDYQLLRQLYSTIRLEIPAHLVQTLDPQHLPAGWDAPAAGEAPRCAGDAWIKSARCAALAVPSAVTPGEWNFLLNPAHSAFTEITAAAPVAFSLDVRLGS